MQAAGRSLLAAAAAARPRMLAGGVPALVGGALAAARPSFLAGWGAGAGGLLQRWQHHSSHGGDDNHVGWWIDDRGNDYRRVGKEKFDHLRNPEKAEAHAYFMRNPGLDVSVEELGLDHAMRRLSRKVVQEGIVERWRNQRRHEYPCQQRRQAVAKGKYKRWKSKVNRLIWVATQARERGY